MKKKEGKKHKQSKADKWFNKIVFWLFVGAIIFTVYYYYQGQILALLQKNPTIWKIYSHISAQITGKTLLGLGYAGFFFSLFFIFIPLEPIYLYYLNLEYNPMFIIFIMLIASTVGLTINYLIGALIGKRLLAKILKYKKFHEVIEKWGGAIIIAVNVIPFFPVQIFSLIIGSARIGVKKFFIYTLLGRFVYLMLLLVSANYVRDYAIPFIQGLF